MPLQNTTQTAPTQERAMDHNYDLKKKTCLEVQKRHEKRFGERSIPKPVLTPFQSKLRNLVWVGQQKSARSSKRGFLGRRRRRGSTFRPSQPRLMFIQSCRQPRLMKWFFKSGPQTPNPEPQTPKRGTNFAQSSKRGLERRRKGSTV